MNLGTFLVLIGTILCAIAVIAAVTRELRGLPNGVLLALGAFLIGLGVLLGAPKLVTNSG
jgi:hypothetical protein